MIVAGLDQMETDSEGVNRAESDASSDDKSYSPGLKGDDFSGYESLDDCYVTFGDHFSPDDDYESKRKKKKRKAVESDDDEYLPSGCENDAKDDDIDDCDDCNDSGNDSAHPGGDGVAEPKVVKISGEEYGCTYCPQVRSNIHDANVHLLTHYEFQCSDCSKKFLRAQDLKIHSRKHSEVTTPKKFEVFSCLFSECTFIAKSKTGIMNHCKIKHRKAEVFTCSQCSYSGTTVTAFNKHITQSHYVTNVPSNACNRYLCPTCGVECKRNSDLKEHMICNHGAQLDRSTMCDICGEVVRSRRLMLHRIAKHGSNTVPCIFDHCGRRFKTNGRMRNHYKRVHLGLRKYKCCYEGCSFDSHSQIGVDNHVNMVHLKNRCFPCPWTNCGKSFLTKQNLEVHSRIHMDLKPLSCHLCEYRCRQRAALNWHLKKKHPELFEEKNSEVSNDSSKVESFEWKHQPTPVGTPALSHARKQGRKGKQMKLSEIKTEVE